MSAPAWAFEDFMAGQTIELGARQISEAEILEFARAFDPQPFHVDADAAAASIFGGIIASGWHTCSLMMRMVVDGILHDSTSLGSPGLDEVRWIKPVRAGDTLRVSKTVLETIASKSKPDRGVIKSEWRAVNQHGELVCTIRCMGMFGRRSCVV